jgi:hypothetical protein
VKILPSFKLARRLTLAGVVFASLFSSVQSTPAHAAGCLNPTYGELGAINLHFPTKGARADIYVNNFDQYQWQTWRSLAVMQNPSNYAEVGWETSDYSNSDQKAHPYKTKNNEGTQQTVRFQTYDISPRDSLHTFRVRDTNDDNHYTSSVDGTALGIDWWVSLDASNSNAITEAERNCTADSLWAQVRNLQFYNNDGNPVSWHDKQSNSHAPFGPYQYCFVSDDAFDVKQNC